MIVGSTPTIHFYFLFLKGQKTMSVTDMLISAIVKKGVLYEARNCDLDFDIPLESKDNIKIHFKAEHMTLRIEKDG